MAHHNVLDLPLYPVVPLLNRWPTIMYLIYLLYPMVPLLNRWPPQATWFTFYTLWCLCKIDDPPQCTWFTFITLWCLYKIDDPPQCTWLAFYTLWCLYKIQWAGWKVAPLPWAICCFCRCIFIFIMLIPLNILNLQYKPHRWSFELCLKVVLIKSYGVSSPA